VHDWPLLNPILPCSKFLDAQQSWLKLVRRLAAAPDRN
jgi:hypothetical protein